MCKWVIPNRAPTHSHPPTHTPTHSHPPSPAPTHLQLTSIYFHSSQLNPTHFKHTPAHVQSLSPISSPPSTYSHLIHSITYQSNPYLVPVFYVPTYLCFTCLCAHVLSCFTGPCDCIIHFYAPYCLCLYTLHVLIRQDYLFTLRFSKTYL